MRLGIEPYQERGLDAEFARAYFLRVSNEAEPSALRELYEKIYPIHTDGIETAELVKEWCRRWNFVFRKTPADWVVRRAQFTLDWWERGKPNPEQILCAEEGGQPIEPLEWWTNVTQMGLPTVLHQGETSPYSFTSSYDLSLRSGETEKQLLQRLLRQHREERARLIEANQRSKQLRSLYLVSTPTLSSFDRHARWAARFQIHGEEVADILKTCYADSGTVDKGINSVLRMVGLTRRPPTRTGRPRKVRKPSV